MSTPFELPRYTGGVNLEDPENEIGPNELSRCTNWELSPLGREQKRLGYGGYGSAPAKVNGDFPVNFVKRYYKTDGTKILLAAANGTLKSGNDGTGAWATLQSGMHTTNLYDEFIYKDRQYILDGTQPFRYDGTNILNAGHFVHVNTGWVLTQGTGGAMNGTGANATYQYRISSVQGDLGEGPASTAKSVVLSSAQNSVALTSLDSAPAAHGATNKYLYRTKANGSVFYLVTILAAAATSYTDLLADSVLGASTANPQLIDTHLPRADSRFALVGPDERTYWCGRPGVNASVVEVSDVGFPDRIVDAEFFAVANNNGDVITGCGRVPGGILFFKRGSLWLLRAFGYGLIQVSSTVGTVAPFSIVEVPGGVMFLGQNGTPRSFINGQLDDDAKGFGRKVRREFLGLTEAAAARIVACYHNNRYLIDYDYQGSTGHNWRRLGFDLVGRKWDGPHENGTKLTASYYSVWDSTKDNGQLVWGDARAANGSYVRVQTRTTYDDGGSKCTATYRTGHVGGRNVKKVYSIHVLGKLSSDAQLQASIITEEHSVSALLRLPGTTVVNPFTWGVSLWGAANWTGQPEGIMKAPFVPKARGTKLQIELTDNGSASTAQIEEGALLVDSLPLK